MKELLTLIEKERERQLDKFANGSDVLKSTNDWIATIASIIGEGVERSGVPPVEEEFRHAMIKAAAVCVAALQHCPDMKERKKLR